MKNNKSPGTINNKIIIQRKVLPEVLAGKKPTIPVTCLFIIGSNMRAMIPKIGAEADATGMKINGVG